MACGRKTYLPTYLPVLAAARKDLPTYLQVQVCVTDFGDNQLDRQLGSSIERSSERGHGSDGRTAAGSRSIVFFRAWTLLKRVSPQSALVA